jgi:K+-transporting ATPase ATPase C chain
MRMILTALRMNLLTIALTGALYPVVVTGAAQLLFPSRANGSLVTDEGGRVVGSALIGQGFATSAYLQPRPSAAGDKGFDATASGGSNLGPTSKKLRERVEADLARLRGDNPEAVGLVPAELVLTSASGLDPEISPETALWQLPRIAHARGIAKPRLRAILDDWVTGRDLGFLGEPRVNVLQFNLALDRQFGKPAGAAR